MIRFYHKNQNFHSKYWYSGNVCLKLKCKLKDKLYIISDLESTNSGLQNRQKIKRFGKFDSTITLNPYLISS